MINSDCAVSKPAMKIVIQNANCTGTKNVRSKKEFRGWISVLVSCFESGTLGVRLLDFMYSTVKTFPGNPQRGQLLDFYKKMILFCVAPRPAPHRTQHRSAPLRVWVPFRAQLQDLHQKGFCFVWRSAPRHTVPSPAPLP